MALRRLTADRGGAVLAVAALALAALLGVVFLSTRSGPASVGAAALTRGDIGAAAAVTPAPCQGAACPAFSIGIDRDADGTDECITRVANSSCSVVADDTFRVNVYLDSLGGASGYTSLYATLQYAGVSRQSIPESVWPGCGKRAVDLNDPNHIVAAGCATLFAPVSYTGLAVTVDFACAGDGAMTLLHGESSTFIHNESGFFTEGEGATESLTIDCGAPLAYPGDTDGDGCPDARELGMNYAMGGMRNFLWPWDYFNPTHDHTNRIDDINLVNMHYGIDQGMPGYTQDTDRTFLGPNPSNLGPPDGKQRAADIVNAVRQYGHDCS